MCLSWEMNAFTKLWLSFEAFFGASPFVNSNTWHLNCNNFILNFIRYCMLICDVFVYSRFAENPPIWSWEINPTFFRWFCHSCLSKQYWGKTHMKASKNCNNSISEEHLAHIRTIVVSLGGKITYVFFYATTELHQWMYVVIFGVFIFFYCW
jgi:hypothetical protein